MENIWKSAKGFKDLCELSAQWCEGKFEDTLTYLGKPAVESEAILPTLANCNRAGFFTTFSQPGDGNPIDGNAQRATIHGYADEDLARRLYALGLETGLLVLAFPPGFDNDTNIPITVNGFQIFTWHGMTDGQPEKEDYRNQLTKEAYHSLLTSWQVIIIDTEWGRDDLLWNSLLEVIEGKETLFTTIPPEELDLETDFVC
jgi:hypothetical protein